MAPKTEAVMVKVYQQPRRSSVTRIEFVLDQMMRSIQATLRTIGYAACNGNRVNTKANRLRFNLRSMDLPQSFPQGHCFCRLLREYEASHR